MENIEAVRGTPQKPADVNADLSTLWNRFGVNLKQIMH
jgi:hypothetical protein